MASGPHTVDMLPIASTLANQLMRRSLEGALADDGPARSGGHPHAAEAHQPAARVLRHPGRPQTGRIHGAADGHPETSGELARRHAA
jgi:hypothetical protein